LRRSDHIRLTPILLIRLETLDKSKVNGIKTDGSTANGAASALDGVFTGKGNCFKTVPFGSLTWEVPLGKTSELVAVQS